jgi:hypothetical protein
MVSKWETYEQVAAYLLGKFSSDLGLKYVEGKQRLEGLNSGTQWEIDAKGIKDNGVGFIVIECRRYTTSRQNQEKLASLAYRIIDTGAEGGILVSPLGFQEGASKVATANNIVEVCLSENSTSADYLMTFLGNVMVGKTDQIIATIEPGTHTLRKVR